MSPRSSSRLAFRPHKLALALALGSPMVRAAVTCDVTQSTDDGTGGTSGTLSWAIKTANTDVVATHPAVHPGGGCTDNTITLKTNVTLTGVMKRLINSNITLQSDGTTRTISGGNAYRPLFIKSGTVTIKNLNLSNSRVKGGDSYYGGGGAGLGGALFIYDGTVTVENATFSSNQAAGGGFAPGRFMAAGGGGMLGSSNAGSAGGGGLFANNR